MNLGFNVSGADLNDFANECLNDMVIAQPPKDRLEYKDKVLESSLSVASRSVLIQKLYSDIISKSHIDFGKIPDSKGKLTSYKYYEDIAQSLGLLNQLLDKGKVEELRIANDLHDYLISLQNDFIFGYKFDIDFIKLTYCSAVYALHEVIGICILSYVDYLKSVNGAEFEFKWSEGKNNVLITKAAKNLVNLFKNGEWQKIMMSFKKDSKNFLGSFFTIASIATGTATLSISWPIVIIVAVILLLFSLRAIIYVGYSSTAKLNNYIKANKQFLEFSMEHDITKTDPKVLAKENSVMSFFDNLSNFLERKILKSDKDAKTEMKKTNAESFSKQELKNATSMTDSSDIAIF
jgi:hypothetical protein